MIHLSPCGPDPATIGTDAVSACASSSCDVVVVVVVLESFFSIFFLRCSHTFVLLSRLLSHSLARSLTHLYVSHTVIAVAFVVVAVVVLTSVCSYYLRCANSLAISFVFVRLFFALPIRYSLLVLSFAHGICFCMTLASAFAASFYVLKKIKTANLCNYAEPDDDGDDNFLHNGDGDKTRRDDDGDEDGDRVEEEEEEDEHAQQAKSSSSTKTTNCNSLLHTHTHEFTLLNDENSAHLFSRIHIHNLQTFVVVSHWQGALC